MTNKQKIELLKNQCQELSDSNIKANSCLAEQNVAIKTLRAEKMVLEEKNKRLESYKNEVNSTMQHMMSVLLELRGSICASIFADEPRETSVPFVAPDFSNGINHNPDQVRAFGSRYQIGSRTEWLIRKVQDIQWRI